MESHTKPTRGQLFVIAAPSGAGKTSLVRELMKRLPLKFSISYTTRKPRPNEQHERDYFFVGKEDFARMRDEGRFLEHAQVFDNYYGTSREQVEQHLARGDNVLLEIDWQGAQQIRRSMPEARTIFVLPPSRAALEERLRGRGTDSEEVIARRLRDSLADLSHWSEFDDVVVNDDFPKAVADLQAIVGGDRQSYRRERSGLRTLLGELLG